jgi:hypothetical protein
MNFRCKAYASEKPPHTANVTAPAAIIAILLDTPNREARLVTKFDAIVSAP